MALVLDLQVLVPQPAVGYAGRSSVISNECCNVDI